MDRPTNDTRGRLRVALSAVAIVAAATGAVACAADAGPDEAAIVRGEALVAQDGGLGSPARDAVVDPVIVAPGGVAGTVAPDALTAIDAAAGVSGGGGVDATAPCGSQPTGSGGEPRLLGSELPEAPAQIPIEARIAPADVPLPELSDEVARIFIPVQEYTDQAMVVPAADEQGWTGESPIPSMRPGDVLLGFHQAAPGAWSAHGFNRANGRYWVDVGARPEDFGLRTDDGPTIEQPSLVSVEPSEGVVVANYRSESVEGAFRFTPGEVEWRTRFDGGEWLTSFSVLGVEERGQAGVREARMPSATLLRWDGSERAVELADYGNAVDRYVVEEHVVRLEHLLEAPPAEGVDEYAIIERMQVPAGVAIWAGGAEIGLGETVESTQDLYLIPDDGFVPFAAIVQAPDAWDAQGRHAHLDVEIRGEREAIQYRVTREQATVYTVETVVAGEWLRSPELVYPVTIDPNTGYNDINGVADDSRDWQEPFSAWALWGRSQYYLRSSQLGIPYGSVVSGLAWYQMDRETTLWEADFRRDDAHAYLNNTSTYASPGRWRNDGPYAWDTMGPQIWAGSAGRARVNAHETCPCPYPCGWDICWGCCFTWYDYDIIRDWLGEYNSDVVWQNRSSSGSADVMYTGSNLIVTAGHQDGWPSILAGFTFDYRTCPNGAYCELYNRGWFSGLGGGGRAWNSFPRTRVHYNAPRTIRTTSPVYPDTIASGYHNVNMYRVILDANYCPNKQQVVVRTSAGTCDADTRMRRYSSALVEQEYDDDDGTGACNESMSYMNLGNPAYGTEYYFKVDEYGRNNTIGYSFVLDAGVPTAEICDGIDNNCNGQIDEGLTITYYRDADGDGVGAGSPVQGCSIPAGYSASTGDCDDANYWRTPGRAETVGNNVDNDCNYRELCYYDSDNDGYRRFDVGGGGVITYPSFQTGLGDHTCTGSGEAEATDPGGDCNDSNAAIRPGATEGVGDQIDQNCDGAEICYADTDNDGYAASSGATVNSSNTSCNDSGEARNDEPRTDCNDNNPLIYPGRTELCDGVDNNCDGSIDNGSGASWTVPVGGTCDDGDADACSDGVGVCRPDQSGTMCEHNGAGVYYPVNLTGVSSLSDWSGNAISASLTQVGTIGPRATVVDEGSTNSRAVNLDGVNDYIDIPNNAYINSTRGWSIAMWVRPETIHCNGNNNWRWLATRGAGIGDGPNLIMEEGNSIAFSINIGGSVQRMWTSGGFAASYAWTHVAFTYDSNTGVARAYRNGALAHQWSLPAGRVVQLANPLRIGNWSADAACPNGSGAFDGMVDDIYVTGRSMAAADVYQLYSNQSLGALVNADICDGLNNDCRGSADDASSGIPSGGAFTRSGLACEGTDADACNEGGLTYCYADQLGSYCGDGPTMVVAANAPYGGLARDVSGWNNHATIYGATWDAGQGAFLFDGVDDSLEIPGHPSLFTPAGYTMEAWIRPQRSTAGEWTGVMGQNRGLSRYPGGEASPRSFHMWLGNSDQRYGPAAFIHHTYGCFNNWNFAQNAYSVPVDAAGFTHVVATVDARGEQRVYLNGTLVASNPSCGVNLGASASGRPIVIGRNLDSGGGANFKGWIRNVAVYPYAVTQATVTANYAAGRQQNQFRNAETCDGLDNDCAAGIDTPYANLGADCDGIDGDFCDEGFIECALDQYSTQCGDTTGTNIELCNESDDNCNGLADEGLTLFRYHKDADSDSWGDPLRRIDVCNTIAPAGYVTNWGDCSDESSLVKPGAAERCNGFDDNCAAGTDENDPQGGGACVASGQLGICANGTQFCPRPAYFEPDANGFIRNWLLLGPFAGTGCAQTPTPPFTPSAVVPEAGMVTAGQAWAQFDGYSGSCGTNCGGGGINFDCVYGDRSNSTVFAYAHVYSPVTRAVRVAIGSDDAARVWINGTAITMGAETTCRGCAVDQNVQNVSLNEGWNSVMIGVSEGGGGWGMALRFLAADGLPVRDLRIAYESAGALECAPGQPVLIGGVPGELCNGLDDNCDGTLDGDEIDDDGDGYDECADGDCDDADVYTHPDATDRCDGKVNDCSGALNPDPGFDVGAACDGNDGDICNDGEKICAPSGTATICRNTGPLRAFDFRDGAGTTVSDSSGNGLHGSLSGYPVPSAGWTTSGHYRGALNFDGSGQHVAMDVTGMNNRNGSIEFWMRPGFTAADTTPRGFFETGSATNSPNWISLFEWTNNYVYLRIGRATATECCGNDLLVPSASLITLNTWSHWIATWEDRGANQSVLRLYVNGALVGERTNATLDGPPIANTARLGFGHTTAFLGAMDEAAFYDYPLSPTQVAARFAAPALDPLGVNHEFCDGLDNNCDASFDEGLGRGTFCDGNDLDSCSDNRQVCADNTVGVVCGTGAGALLRFDDDLSDLNAFDASGAGNHGLLSANTAQVNVGGRVALDLFKNRNSRANIPAAAGPASEFTFAAWVRPSTSGTDATEAIVSRSTDYAATNCDANGFAVWNSGRVWFQCQNFISASLRDALAVRGVWTHVAVTYDRSRIRVYVNGVLRNSSTRWLGDAFRWVNWNSDIWLGQDQDAPNALFEDTDAFFGSIDDAAWFGHALPSADVASLYSAGFAARDVNHEFCDTLDNDCRAGVDDAHIPPLGDACLVGLGECAAPGFRICAADGFGTICDGTPGSPSPEVCNGLDDDCDGLVDEDWPEIGASCSAGVGACRRNGAYFCSADGTGTICSAVPGTASPEICDNVDNDCDGAVDDNVTRTCFTGPVGSSLTPPSACRSGVQACTAGLWGSCAGEVLPSAELCDDVDWDCNGVLNNGFNAGEVCTNGQLGVCERSGAWYCDSTTSTACDAPTIVPGTEVCGDGLDNDCDGETDEGTVIATITVDAVQSGDPSFDYSTCDITDGSATMCSAVTFTVDVSELSPYAVLSGSPVDLLLAGATPVSLSSGLTLPRTVWLGGSDTFTYCWDNSSVQADAKVIVEIDTGCNTLASDPAATPAADLIDCGPETCDGGDNNGNGRVDELPDACFGNPTLTCVSDSGRYSCVPTLEDGAPACTGEGCEPSGDGSAAVPVDPSRTAAAAAEAQAAGQEPGSQAGCAAAGAGTALPAVFGALPFVVLLRRRRRRPLQ